MLLIRSDGSRLCDRVTRRDAICIGGLQALGLSLSHLMAPARGLAAANERGIIEPSGGKAKSCIVLFLLGGPPQHSTWDPKPAAPAEVRGEFAAIDSRVPGVQIGELLPRLALAADKLCLLRAVSTNDNAHSSSGYYMLTGRPHAPLNVENANPGAPNDWPSMGAVVQYLTHSQSALPASVRLPMHIFNTDGSVWPGQDAGFLGPQANPWLLRCEPAATNYRIPEFSLPLDMSVSRLQSRHTLLDEFNGQLDAARRGGKLQSYNELTQRAFDLLSSTRSRNAFDLAQETAGTRERYGASQFGQSVLLSRRLVEAGVRLVQVNWFRAADEPTNAPCWDSHAKEADRLKNVLCPPLDQAFSALVEDLQHRGMLDETLVVCMAEFGRTPKFNGAGGRDHWGPVFSIALAGGGIRGGIVHGASDRLGAYPREGMVRPEDVTATIFHCLGFSPETIFYDAQRRPLPISRGNVIAPILA